MYCKPWDEIIGRVYLLKAHCEREKAEYAKALPAFEQALALLAGHGDQEYYYRALADKALVQCMLDQSAPALAMLDEASANLSGDFFASPLKVMRAAALILTGAFAEALAFLDEELGASADDDDLTMSRATCLLHMGRYDEALAAYIWLEKNSYLPDTDGLEAARQRRQPDWESL